MEFTKTEAERLDAGTATAFITESRPTVSPTRRPMDIDGSTVGYFRIVATERATIKTLRPEQITALGFSQRAHVATAWARQIERIDKDKVNPRDPMKVTFSIVSIEIDRSDRVRLLARQDGRVPFSYVTSHHLAMDDLEAVPPEYQRKISQDAEPTSIMQRRERRSEEQREWDQMVQRMRSEVEAFPDRNNPEVRKLKRKMGRLFRERDAA